MSGLFESKVDGSNGVREHSWLLAATARLERGRWGTSLVQPAIPSPDPGAATITVQFLHGCVGVHPAPGAWLHEQPRQAQGETLQAQVFVMLIAMQVPSGLICYPTNLA